MWNQQQQQQQAGGGMQNMQGLDMDNPMIRNLLAMQRGNMNQDNLQNIQSGMQGNNVPLPNMNMQQMQQMQHMNNYSGEVGMQMQMPGPPQGMPGPPMNAAAGGGPPPPPNMNNMNVNMNVNMNNMNNVNAVPGPPPAPGPPPVPGAGVGGGIPPPVPMNALPPPIPNSMMNPNNNFGNNQPSLLNHQKSAPLQQNSQMKQLEKKNSMNGINNNKKKKHSKKKNSVKKKKSGEGVNPNANAMMRMQMQNMNNTNVNANVNNMQQQQQMIGGLNPMMSQQQQQMMKMQQMKQMMEQQAKQNLPKGKSGRSLTTVTSNANLLIGSNPLYKDHTTILMALKLFGCENPKLWKDYVQNFKKQKYTDSSLKIIDCCDIKLFHKLIPDNNLLRHRMLSWIKYDMQESHGLHESKEDNNNNGNGNDRVVNLNVCGRLFSTLTSSLGKTGSSFFEKITRDNSRWFQDNTGAYFINRDPLLFEVILNYLRTNKLEFDPLQLTFEQLQAEFRYFDIQFPAIFDPSLPVQFRLEYCSMYDQTQKFFASQFRIYPKAVQPTVMKYISIPKDFQNADQFFEWRMKLPIILGYQLCDTKLFSGDPQEWVWTYAEIYKRRIWNEALKPCKK